MKFPLKAASLALVLQGIYYAVGATLLPQLLSYHLSLFLLVFFGLSILVHWLTIRISKTAGDQFPNYYMGIIGIKMFSFLIMVFVYFWLMGKEGKVVIMAALLAHFAFTALEVISTVKLLKRE